jgi:hypothetical protein
MLDPDIYNTIYIKPKWEVAKLFHEKDDPGSEFEMSEWFEKSKKTPPPGLLLVKDDQNQIMKAFHFPSHRVSWCRWEDGGGSGGHEIIEWAYIRKIGGDDRPDVKEWKKVYAKESMSK